MARTIQGQEIACPSFLIAKSKASYGSDLYDRNDASIFFAETPVSLPGAFPERGNGRKH